MSRKRLTPICNRQVRKAAQKPNIPREQRTAQKTLLATTTYLALSYKDFREEMVRSLDSQENPRKCEKGRIRNYI